MLPVSGGMTQDTNIPVVSCAGRLAVSAFRGCASYFAGRLAVRDGGGYRSRRGAPGVRCSFNRSGVVVLLARMRQAVRGWGWSGATPCRGVCRAAETSAPLLCVVPLASRSRRSLKSGRKCRDTPRQCAYILSPGMGGGLFFRLVRYGVVSADAPILPGLALRGACPYRLRTMGAVF